MRRALLPTARSAVPRRVPTRPATLCATERPPLLRRSPVASCFPPHPVRRYSNTPSSPSPGAARAAQPSSNAAKPAASAKSEMTPEAWSAANEDHFRNIANLLHDNKHFQAEGQLRNVIQEITRRFGAEHPLLEEPMWALANAFMGQQKMNEASQCWKRIIHLEEKWHGPADPLVARAHLLAAQTYVSMDRVIDAEKEYVPMVSRVSRIRNGIFMELYKKLPADPEVKKDAAISRKISAEILVRRGQYEEANRIFEDILNNWVSFLPPEGRVMVLESHATSYEGLQKFDLAIEILQLCRQFVRAHIGANSPDAVRTEQALSRCWQAKGMRMKALEHAEAAFHISLKSLGEANQFTITSRLHVADSLMLLDNDKEAEEQLSAVVKTLKEFRKSDPLLPIALQTLATAQLKQGKAEEAEKRILEAIVLFQKQKGASDPSVTEAKELLDKARLMRAQRMPDSLPRDAVEPTTNTVKT